MRLRAFRAFLLPVFFAMALAPPPAFAQSPGDTDLKALNARVLNLSNAGKYIEAIPLAEQYVKEIKSRHGDNAPEYAVALYNLATMLRYANRLAEAETLYRRALAIDEAIYGADHPQTATDLNRLAQLLQATNRLNEAETIFRRVLGIREKTSGHDHPETATALNNLALLLQETNRSVQAEQLYRRALVIAERDPTPDQALLMATLNNLAALLVNTNRPAEAELHYRRALTMREKIDGPDHPDVAIALNNLALLLEARNRLAEAEALYRRALAIDEKSFGPDHPDVASRLNNLAELLSVTNRFAEAEPLYRHALAINEKSFGPDHPDVATDLNNLALLLIETNRVNEAEPLLKRALVINEKSYGPDHPKVAAALNNLAQMLANTNRLSEAEPLLRRALAIDEKSFGSDHPDVATRLNNLAALLHDRNWLAEAESLYRRALAIDEKSLGPDHPNVATDLGNLAQLYNETNRLVEAEPLYRRALGIEERSFGPDHPKVALALNNLATLLQDMNRLAEAEPLLRRALAINEKSYGPDHPKVALALNNLAQQLVRLNRFTDAEAFMRRALAVEEKSNGPNHPDVARDLNNLAMLLRNTNRPAEAEPLLRRALAIYERSYGSDHPSVALQVNNLAMLLWDTNRPTETEPLLRRALQIYEKSLGPDHPEVALVLNNLATLLHKAQRFTEAEPLYRRALAIDEQSLGENHPKAILDLTNLAILFQDQGQWSRALALLSRVKDVIVDAKNIGGGGYDLAKANLAQRTPELRSYARALYRADPGNGGNLIEAFEVAQWALQNEAAGALSLMASRFTKADPRLAHLIRARQDLLSAYEGAFLRLDTATGKANTEAATRARALISEIETKLVESLAQLQSTFPAYADLTIPKPLPLSEAQMLLGERQALVLILSLPQLGEVPEETIVFAVTNKEARWASTHLGMRGLQAAVIGLRCGLDASLWTASEISREVCAEIVKYETSKYEFPPFSAAIAHKLYKELFGALEDLIKDKSLLVVASDALTQLPFEVLVTNLPAETQEEVSVLGIDGNDLTLDERQALMVPPGPGVQITEIFPGGGADAAGLKAGDVVLSIDDEEVATYRQFISKIRSHSSGSKVRLNLARNGVRMTIEATLGKRENYKLHFLTEGEGQNIAWLGQRQAITVLPSVGSLKALRVAKDSGAPEPFVGFGNPLLTGVNGTDKRAWAKQNCSNPAPPKQSRIASLAASFASLFRSGAVDVEELRRNPPLPETADELCAVGRALGVPEAKLEKAIYLGERATVSKLKALSKSGDLARARVVHFATHGLLAGETAMFAKNKAEPALLLTPPTEASEEDNGLLTASEVAQLNLNADWVVMSACNTAAGSNEGAEALSGLARAFFYAGARALLVSHWYVDSEAAVAITTGAVNAMKAEPGIGRAAALRQAEAALIAKGGRFPHPSVWAPFVLVGNGGQ